MKTNLHSVLSKDEVLYLTDLHKNSIKHWLRIRCHALLLSQSKKVQEIAQIFNKQEATIRTWINLYKKNAQLSLIIKAGRGLKPKLAFDNLKVMEIVKEQLDANPLKLNYILDLLTKELNTLISKKNLICFLKKHKYTYRRIRKKLKGKPDPEDYESKIAKIKLLIELEKINYIGIYYADESGFSETPYVPYGWQVKGGNLSISTQKGRRWNVFGIMDKFGNLFANKTLKGIDSEFVINSINSFSINTTREPRSIIILDNAKIHGSIQFQENIERWKEEGIEIFYLPTYSPELNLIEILWKKIKYEWFVPKDYESWSKITNKLDDIINNFGTKYKINFKS